MHAVLAALAVQHQKGRAIRVITRELGFTAAVDGHIAFGIGKTVLVQPGLGLVAVAAFSGGVHDHLFGFDGGGQGMDLLGGPVLTRCAGPAVAEELGFEQPGDEEDGEELEPGGEGFAGHAGWMGKAALDSRIVDGTRAGP